MINFQVWTTCKDCGQAKKAAYAFRNEKFNEHAMQHITTKKCAHSMEKILVKTMMEDKLIEIHDLTS